GLVHQFDQGSKELGALLEPTAERAPRNQDVGSGQFVLLAIQRHVLDEFADDDKGQQPGCGQAASDRARGDRGCGHAVLTAGTGVLRIDMTQHLDLTRYVVELLGHVLTDLRLGAAASAGALVLRYIVEHIATWQMITEGTSAVPLAVLPRHGLTGITFGGFGRNARHGLRVEEMALPRSLWQSLPPRPKQQPLQG